MYSFWSAELSCTPCFHPLVLFFPKFSYTLSHQIIVPTRHTFFFFARNRIGANGYDTRIYGKTMVLYSHGMYIIADWTNNEYLTRKSIIEL